MRELIPTDTWLQTMAPKLLLPPPLYEVPPEGWLAWAAALSEAREARPGTHSGRLIEARAPAWAQWQALQQALNGETHPSPAAHAVRVAFEAGQALPLTAPHSVERFATFVPVLRYDPLAHTYAVGTGKTQQVLAVPNHVAALNAGARWFDRQYELEIAYQRERAQQEAARLPAFYLDTVTSQLEYDGLLLSERGDLVALLNGAHGCYLVASDQWCYTLRISPGVATKLAVLGAREDGLRLLLRLAELPTFLGLSGWQGDGDGGYTWDGGRAVSQGSEQWRVLWGGQPRAVAVYKKDRLRILGRGNTELAASVIPPLLVSDTGLAPALAWAVWRIARLIQQRAVGKDT